MPPASPSKISVITLGSIGSINAAATEALVGPAAGEDSSAGAGGVVGSVSEIRNAVGDPEPIRGRVTLVRQPDASGVDEARSADHRVVLLMCVTADH